MDSLNQIITLQECVDVIAKSRSTTAEIVSYEVTKIGGAKSGFLGEHLYLTITLQDGGSERFFLKALPIFNVNKRKYIEKAGFFKKESTIYNEIFRTMPSVTDGIRWRPKCYLARPDLLIFHDVGIEHYCHAPERYEYHRSHVQLVLKSLAALHANSINTEAKTGKNIGEVYGSLALFEVSTLDDNLWFITGLKALESVALNVTKYKKIKGFQFSN